MLQLLGPVGQGGPWLERGGGDARMQDLCFDDVSGAGKGDVGITLQTQPFHGQVSGHLFVKRCGRARLISSQKGRRRLYLELDQFKSFLGGRQGLRHYRGDRLAHCLDLSRGEERQGWRLHRTTDGIHRQTPQPMQMISRQHSLHARH